METASNSLTAQLRAYQALPEWDNIPVAKSQVGDALGAHGGSVPAFGRLQSIRYRSQESLLLAAAERSLKEYSSSIKAAAFCCIAGAYLNVFAAQCY